jgi:hypothetical protein
MQRSWPLVAVALMCLPGCGNTASRGDSSFNDLHESDVADVDAPDGEAEQSDADSRDAPDLEMPHPSCEPASPVQFDGVFGNEASVAVSTAKGRVFVRSSESNCGCATRAELTLFAAPDCVVEISAGPPGFPAEHGPALTIADVQVQAGPVCAGAMGVAAGLYSGVGLKSGALIVNTASLSCGEGPGCSPLAVDLQIVGYVTGADGKTILLEFRAFGDVDTAVEPSSEPCPFACDCGGRECGPSPCGGDCGTCAAPESCDASGTCSCTPDCAGAECGDDGCWGSCGSCRAGWTCEATQCIPEDLGCGCGTRTCGQGGCGELCGLCPGDSTCNFGQCGTSCTNSPTLPGSAWLLDTLVVPILGEDGFETCRDFTGEGQADNGLGWVPIDSVWPPTDGRGTLFVVERVGEGWMAAEYFGFQAGAPDPWVLDPAWLDPTTCTSVSRLSFDRFGDTLVSHPPTLLVPVPWGDAWLTFPLRDITLTIDALPLEAASAGTVSGVLTAVLTRRDLADALAYFDLLCSQADKKPRMCGVSPYFRYDHWFDLVYTSNGYRERGDGEEPDAGSVCLLVTLRAVDILGFTAAMTSAGGD